MSRNILTVMDALEAVEPKLKESLDDLRSSVRYSPPEHLGFLWGRLMEVLEREAPPSHPRFQELVAICNGDPNGPCPA